MKKLALVALFLASHHILPAQENLKAWPGPKGVFLFTGNAIATGKPLSSYLIERSDSNNNWVKVEELKLPATSQEFLDKVNLSKSLFPDQPLPMQAKLELMYNKAKTAATTDSLSGWKNYPVRIALGVMYFDSKATKGTFKYRITQLDTLGREIISTVTNEVLMPHKAVFDSIHISESSRTSKLNFIKWYSVGDNPAPLFQPFRYEDGKTVSISGWTGKNVINDTCYYSFTDSVAGPVKAEQYFIVPYDPFGNAGVSSEILKVLPDTFSRTKISRLKAARNPGKYGIRVSWFCNMPAQVGKLILFRSESKDQGYASYALIPEKDTVFTDLNAWPGRTYYYYLKAYDKTGKRFFTSDKVWFKAELPKKPAVPQVNVSSMSSGVEVIITVPEGETEGVRIFRSAGTNGQPVAISSLLPVNGEKSIRFADTSNNLSGRTIYAYQARCELKGAGVSDLSEKALIRPSINTPPADPAFIRGAVNNNRINLIWQNTLQSDTTLTGYLVSRREGALPAKTINTGLNSWSDSLVRPGETYSYTINSIDNQGYVSPGACRLVVSLALNNPVPPDYIKAKRTFVNQYFTVIEWADVMFDGFTQFNLYRQAKGEEPVLIASLKPGTTRYTDKPEGENSLFRYFITTVHSSGAESLPSEKVMPE